MSLIVFYGSLLSVTISPPYPGVAECLPLSPMLDVSPLLSHLSHGVVTVAAFLSLCLIVAGIILCLFCPMELPHDSYYLLLLLDICHCLFHCRRVASCLVLSLMVAGCLSLSLLSHEVVTCLSLSLNFSGRLSLSPCVSAFLSLAHMVACCLSLSL